jgi:hypothetical protein
MVRRVLLAAALSLVALTSTLSVGGAEARPYYHGWYGHYYYGHPGWRAHYWGPRYYWGPHYHWRAPGYYYW